MAHEDQYKDTPDLTADEIARLTEDEIPTSTEDTKPLLTQEERAKMIIDAETQELAERDREEGDPDKKPI